MLGLSFEDVKTIGSFGGLVSAAILLWDRFSKSRPEVQFHRTCLMGRGQPFISLSVTNRAKGQILIDVQVAGGSVKVSKAATIDGFTSVPGFTRVLEPETSENFPITLRGPAWNLIWVFWRNSARPGRWQVPFIRLARPSVLRRLRDAG